MSSPATESSSTAGGRDPNSEFWRKIERFLKARNLVPVLGPGIITFGEDDRLLYPWVTEEIASRLDIDPIPVGMHELVCAHLRNNGRVEDVCIEIDDLLDTAKIEPGPILRTLASVSQCRLFFTLGFDPLMERALNLLRGAGRSVTKTWRFSLDSVATDLPNPAAAGTLLGYLFGKASPNPGYLLWDADAIEFVWQIQRQLPALNTLGQTLSENNLLIMGAGFPDWLVRFLLRAIRQRPFTEGSGKNFLLADTEKTGLSDAAVFYDSLRRGIQLFPGDPLAFAREFCRRAHAQEPPLTAGVVPGTTLAIPLMEPTVPDGAIFISYAHAASDAEGTFRIVEKLRAAGCLVWLDDDRLTCGDNFENHLEDAVRRHCGFFVSVISRTTEGRAESYYHKERNWAAQRVQSMTDTRPFYFPVTIDDTPLPPRQEPRAFAAIDAEVAPRGEISEVFINRLATLQQRLMASAAGTGNSPPIDAGAAPGPNLTIPPMEATIPAGAIFISYAHAMADAGGAFRLVEKLRAAGCLVWLDGDRLASGDNFENQLEDAVLRRCCIFVSIISRTTESRAESYFHKERNWAAQRAQFMTDTRPFYFPVAIDDTPLPLSNEPRVFAAIEVEMAPGGEASDAFVTRLAELQKRLMAPTAGASNPQ